MTPSDDCFIDIDFRCQGQPARVTMLRRDGGVPMEFDLRCISPGPATGLSVATILSASGAWEITYEIISGRVVDICDTAMPDLTHTPAECEVQP